MTLSSAAEPPMNGIGIFGTQVLRDMGDSNPFILSLAESISLEGHRVTQKRKLQSPQQQPIQHGILVFQKHGYHVLSFSRYETCTY